MFSTALLRKHAKKSVKNIVILVITVQLVVVIFHVGQCIIWLDLRNFIFEIINMI